MSVLNPEKLSLVDYHIHSPYCGHAQGKTIEYVESAIEMGLEEICFTDHLGRYYLTASQKRRYWDWGMSEFHIARYLSEIDDLKDIFEDRISIKAGLEIDYIPGAEELVSNIVQQYSFDFLLGSIHCIPELGWKHLAHYQPQDSWPMYESYFSHLHSACSSGLFDSIAHIDFIWRYIDIPSGCHDRLLELIHSTIIQAQSNDLAVEINANGYIWSSMKRREPDPFEHLLTSISQNNVCVTLGSDAHKPQMVGKSFPVIADLLLQYGISSLCRFDKRQRSLYRFAE